MRTFLIFALVALLIAVPLSAERIRTHMMITDGQVVAASNIIRDSPLLDIRGGGLDTFSVDLQRVGGAGAGWNGASWVMERTGLDTVSFELFVKDVIEELGMKHNTGLANVQVVTCVHEDDTPGQTAREGFDACLANVAKKPWALEEVP